jgi:predicted GNAT family N-acyltransferase
MEGKMEISTIGVDSKLYSEVVKLRYEILFKPFGAKKSDFQDDYKLDLKSYHIGAIENGEIVGYCRLSNKEKGMQISRVFVIDKYAKMGIGSKLINAAVDLSKNVCAEQVFLNSRVEAMKFYEKLGFKEVGPLFISDVSGVYLKKMINILI